MAVIGRQLAIGSTKKIDSISALQNNVRVTFPLTITSSMSSYELKPVSPFAIFVVRNGSPLEPNKDFTVSEGNITFLNGSTPLSTDTIFITTFGEPINIGSPNDGVIGDTHFQLESVTYDKLTQAAKDAIIGDIITFGL